MKYFKILLFLALCLNGWAVQAKCHPQLPTELTSLERYTIVGDKVRRESGTLFAKQGFIVSLVINETPIAFIPPEELAIFTQINGQPIMDLVGWLVLDKNIPNAGNYFCNFSRSASTYLVDGVEVVTVSVKQATVKTPKVSIIAVDPVANETAGDTGQFMIQLNAPSAKKIRVRFTVDGKASRGRDYVRFPNSVMVPAGSTTATIDVVPIDDARRENTENVKVKLLPPQSAASFKVRRASASVQIFDND